MSNHIHLVIKLNPSEVDTLSAAEIIERWTCLYKGPRVIQRWCTNDTLCPAELQAVTDYVEVYRQRLTDLSWFMKCLNEYIAREANKEDSCTGHFWESRYKSQALLTEEALLSAMAYVDLNPVRAAMAPTPEDSDYTSIQERITPTPMTQQRLQPHSAAPFTLPNKPLLPFNETITQDTPIGIPFSLSAYIELVDWTGRSLRDDKRGSIDNGLPPIIERLSINKAQWLQQTAQFETIFYQRFARRNKPRKIDHQSTTPAAFSSG